MLICMVYIASQWTHLYFGRGKLSARSMITHEIIYIPLLLLRLFLNVDVNTGKC